MKKQKSFDLVPFNYGDNLLRVITGKDGSVEFVAKDVAAVLEHSDTQKMVKGLDEDEKGKRKVLTLGGEQEIITITEAGFYTTLIRSNKPQAKPFRRWVTHEVLPAIRKTGGYSTIDSEADLHLKADRVFQQKFRTLKAMKIPENEARTEAVTHTLDVTGIDFSKYLELVPAPDNRKNTADLFFDLLTKLYQKNKEKTAAFLDVRENRIWVYIPGASEALKSDFNIDKKDFYADLKAHPTYLKQTAHRFAGGCKKTWSFQFQIKGIQLWEDNTGH